MKYKEYIDSRRFEDPKAGFEILNSEMTESLKPHQKYLVKWACAKGRAAIFADTGLGKTRMMCEWARIVSEKNGCRVLFLSPLAVAEQTVIEAEYVGMTLQYEREDTGGNFLITNYEMIQNFDASKFGAIVIDESSILKNFEGSVRLKITKFAEKIPFRLSCTATPSPNDYMELGTQSEFLGIMPRSEMLAMFFKHDGKETSKWTLKGHARAKFWEWMSTWSAVIRSPSDLGFDGAEYKLPGLHINFHEIEVEGKQAIGLTERRIAKRNSLPIRVAAAASLANATDDFVLIWCNLNDESNELCKAIPGSIEVIGSDKIELKKSSLLDFSSGRKRVLISKSKIAGFGMNWQHCNTIIFVGLTDSFEQFYQAIRRCYRFGQLRDVNVHCFLASNERAVVENLKRKEIQHESLASELQEFMKENVYKETSKSEREYTEYFSLKNIEIPSFLKAQS